MPISQSTIKKLLDGAHGEEFKKWITQNILSLDRVSDIEYTTEKEIALEAKARKRAAEILAKILKPFLEYQEPGEVDKQEIY